MIRIINANEFTNTKVKWPPAPAAVTDLVADIISDVRNRGDEALREYTRRFEGCLLDSFEVTGSEIDSALIKADPDFIEVMRHAAANIEDFHRRQIRQGFEIVQENGVILGQRIIPLRRVGIYIPGGTAPYPSSVLMNCIPAKLAGVEEIIMATPPSEEGSVNAGILAAAKIAGVDKIFKIGGAQAIAALAYGTETIPRVDKITGPGNAYVAEAKRQVFGVVGIDMIAGPSDILIIADDKAAPALVAADLLSQCEHGDESKAVLITTCAQLAETVCAEIETQLATLPRMRKARNAIDNNSRIIVVDSLEKAFDISNELAPEHLEIFLDNPMQYLDRVKSAGSIFLGKNSPEALGDYYAGPNHTLPTSGTARFSSPLSVDDFTKKSSYTHYTEDALRSVGDEIVFFAEKEGLCAHAKSVSIRLDNK